MIFAVCHTSNSNDSTANDGANRCHAVAVERSAAAIINIPNKYFQKNHGYHPLRFAGLFNLPIPLRFAFGIGVSRIKITNLISFKNDRFIQSYCQLNLFDYVVRNIIL